MAAVSFKVLRQSSHVAIRLRVEINSRSQVRSEYQHPVENSDCVSLAVPERDRHSLSFCDLVRDLKVGSGKFCTLKNTFDLQI